MNGEIGILNVGAGDTKLSFDPTNPQECIRAARIVKDMLRRGYALLIAIKNDNGTTNYQRVWEFNENTYEYIIADFDPIEAQQADETDAQTGTSEATEAGKETRPKVGRGKWKRTKAIPAGSTSGVAVARTAGG